MRLVRHPFFERDLIGIAEHVLAVTGGDLAAAFRRLDEVDELLHAIIANPGSGVRLGGELDGWRVRHGGRDHRLTIVFRPDMAGGRIYLAIVAFGGRDWMREATGRRSFGASG